MSLDTKLHALLDRRRVLGMISAVAAMPLLSRASELHVTEASARVTRAGNACVLSPELTEGPFFVDERLNRSDLTSGPAAGVADGVPLLLKIDLQKIAGNACGPLAGVQIDVWHANALGRYSDERAGMRQADTRGQKWLRGFQVSDDSGQVNFKTIYPGWYPGRTAHLHVKARVFDARGNATYEFNTQLFFDETINDAVFARPAYGSRGRRSVRNAQDDIYGDNTSLLVDVAASPSGTGAYVASATLGLDLLTSRRPASFRGGRPPGFDRRPNAGDRNAPSPPIARPGTVEL